MHTDQATYLPNGATIPRGATIRQEYTTCGKCPRQHGPYWYAWWRDHRGAQHRLYLGKQLPEALTTADHPAATPREE